jgi:hypothetical protein
MKTLTKTLTTRFLCDANIILTAELVSIKGNFATILFEGNEKRLKIYTSKLDGTQYIFPLGRYSMAPSFKLYPPQGCDC